MGVTDKCGVWQTNAGCDRQMRNGTDKCAFVSYIFLHVLKKYNYTQTYSSIEVPTKLQCNHWPGSSRFYPSWMEAIWNKWLGFYSVLLSFTQFYSVLLGFTRSFQTPFLSSHSLNRVVNLSFLGSRQCMMTNCASNSHTLLGKWCLYCLLGIFFYFNRMVLSRHRYNLYFTSTST
jgi:hypothetical protein